MHVVHHPPPGRQFVLPLRVYYEDTDAAGVVYYANYFKFCERARTEWLRAVGFSNSILLAERGLVFVVRAVKGDFLAPAVLDDALQVVSTLDKLGGASLVFGQRVMRGEELLFDAQIVIACVDLAARRASPLPADVKQQLQALIRS
jgi:acyl-CoA thioester hydrolase